MSDRAVPFDLAAERATLGSCLMERDAIIVARNIVAVSDFYLEKHALIYEAMLECFADKVPPEVVTVADRLKRREVYDLVGGIAFLADLEREVHTAVHVDHYARIVVRASRSRRLIELGAQIAARGYSNDPDSVMEEAEQLLQLERRAAADDDWQGGMIDGADVWKKPHKPRPFVVEGVLPVGVTILHALPKKKKSWLAKDFCYAVASGGKAMGFLQAEKGEALYLNLEMDEELLNERLRVMYPDSAPPRGVKFFYEWPRMDAGLFSRLENYLNARPYTKIVILDTMVRVFPDDNIAREGYRHDSRLIEQFTNFNKNRGLAIVLVHHSRKGGRGGSDPVLNSLGSVGIPGSVDSVLELEIDEDDPAKGRLLRSGRRIKDDKPLPIKWDVQIGRWIVNSRAGAVTPERKALIDLLADQDGPLSPQRIAALLDRPPPSIRRLCKEMHAAGQLINMQGLYALPDVDVA